MFDFEAVKKMAGYGAVRQQETPREPLPTIQRWEATVYHPEEGEWVMPVLGFDEEDARKQVKTLLKGWTLVSISEERRKL
jgi:hypothetical protein